MTPIKQTISGPQGNCMAACVATILDCPIEDVPDVAAHKDADEAILIINTWLKPRGLAYAEMIVPGDDASDFFNGKDFYHIILGKTNPKSELLHAVVGRQGRIVFDPSPDCCGIIKDENIRIGAFIFCAV